MESREQQVVAPNQHRARAKQACEPCKIRKRKCDGQNPCSACEHHGYQCHFGQQGRKRSGKLPIVPPPPQHQSSSSSADTLRSNDSHARLNTEMNSGCVFPAEIAAKLGDARILRTKGYGWNLGLRNVHIPSEKNVTWIITKREWDLLLQVYITKIHCIYGFIHIDDLVARTANRWHDLQATDDLDHIIGGIAAIACLFSSEVSPDQEKMLLACARDYLETSLESDPNYNDAQAWLLRTLYLRCSSPPHAAWMASCTTMHIIEAAGMNHERLCQEVDADPVRVAQIQEHSRRTFWLAKLLNTWIGWECGRSPSPLSHTRLLPKRMAGDFTLDLIDLFRLSEVLEPDKQSTATELEDVLSKVTTMAFTLHALILSQSNLCFTLYRRLRLMNTIGQASTIRQVISVGQRGLQASLDASAAGSPWWHVSNVPFQYACTLLAIDTRESLSKLNEAVHTLRAVGERFPTAMVHKAQTTLSQLIQIARKRRQQDLNALQASIVDHDPWQINHENIPTPNDLSPGLMHDIEWNASAFDEVEWNQFWTGPFGFV